MLADNDSLELAMEAVEAEPALGLERTDIRSDKPEGHAAVETGTEVDSSAAVEAVGSATECDALPFAS